MRRRNNGHFVEQLHRVCHALGRSQSGAGAVVAFNDSVVFVGRCQAVALPFMDALSGFASTDGGNHRGFLGREHVDFVLQVLTVADGIVGVKGFCGLSHFVYLLKEFGEVLD